MKNILNAIWEIGLGRYFLIVTSVCAVIMSIMLLTGQVTVAEMIDLQKKFIEYCPFCM